MLRGIDTPVRYIRNRVFTEVARIGFKEDTTSLKDDMEMIPYKIVNDDTEKYRESTYRSRAIVRERVRLAMGLSLRPEDQPTPHVDNGPGNPYALEPVPALVHFMLIVGYFCAHHRNGRHEARQNSADTCDFVVDVYDNAVCSGPHILAAASSFRRRRGGAEQTQRKHKDHQKADAGSREPGVQTGQVFFHRKSPFLG